MMMNIFSKIQKAAASWVMKGTGNWDALWLRAMESQLTGNSVTKPYAQHWAVYLAVSRIATNIASTPFVLYKGDSQVDKHPVIDLMKKPNPYMSRYQLWEGTCIFLELRGEAFWLMDKSRGMAAGISRIPSAIYVFNPDRFKPAQNAAGELTGWVYNGKIPLTLDEVIHFKLFNPYDDIRGLAPLEAARISMETDYSAIQYNRNFFKNSAEPSGVLTTEKSLTDDQFKRLLAQWQQRHGGVNKSHKIALLEGGLQYKNVGLSHQDMAFIEQRKFSLEEILGVYGVPKAIALTQDLRYATAQVQRKAFWIDTLLPLMTLIEEKLAAEFFPRVAPELEGYFDTDQIEELRDDLDKKSQIADRLWRMGFTANEINARLDMGFEDKPWRDKWWTTVSTVPVEVAERPPEERTARSAAASAALPRPAKDARREAARRSFLTRQQAIENAAQPKIKRHFFNQRRRVLAIINSDKAMKTDADANALIAELELIWNDEDMRLMLMARPMLTDAVSAGAEFATELLGGGISFDITDPRIANIIESRVNRVTGINETVWSGIQENIREGLAGGETLEQISERIRRIYNMAEGRSRVIARTETAGAMNEASHDRYSANGVEKKRWITAHDEHVRDTHEFAEAEGAIPINQTFANGLRYPHDPNGSSGEIINCRCCLAPVVEED